VKEMKCQHDRERTRCRDCGGGSFCPHQIVRSTCSICSTESVWKRYAYQAAKRGLKFELSLEQFKQIVFQSCALCGDYGSPRGIDRRDSSRGYEMGNVQSCCGICNRLKSDLPEHQFIGHAAKICRHQDKLKKARAVEIDQARPAGAAPAP
jgi:hypothetical protein